jgi:dipeptidyl aminopeptidase/acylaminoacyl peptidase
MASMPSGLPIRLTVQTSGYRVRPVLQVLQRAAAALLVGACATAAAAQTPSFRLPTADDFGREAAIRNVSLSPDGKHIAALMSPDGVTAYVAVWATDAVDKPPVTVGCGDRNRCMGVSFIKNDRLSINIRQQINSGSIKGHLFRSFITRLDGSNQVAVDGSKDPNNFESVRIVDSLPLDPRRILITVTSGANAGSYYKVDVYSGSRQKVFQGSDKFFEERRDLNGDFRARQSLGYENGDAYIAQWIREGDSWVEHFRWYAKNREPTEVVGFTADPNILYVRTNNGGDNTGIYEYDIKARKILEQVFAFKSFDALGVVQSRSANNYGDLLGFFYGADTTHVYWTDEKLAALTKGVRKALGVRTVPVQWTDIATGEKIRYATADGFDVELSDWSDDFKYAIVTKVGPRQPVEYYLLTDSGQLSKLGASRPWFDTTAMGDARLVQYAARDGLMIPGILTTPRKDIYGPGPYPTLIVPHGGPWARDDLDWDPSGWNQYFAARGYAVLQPQYRGSDGWGQKLWRAGDREWGQKMQDDKDDGAKWLIAQGIANPDRIAMHGYSYGGYAAMAASVRPNGLYQCALAGAGPSSMNYMQTRTSFNSFQEEYQGQTIDGLSPLDNASKVSIPVFIYHGERDTNVPISQSEKFVAALKANGKFHKYLELKGMGHSYNTWEAGQTAEVLNAVEAFLKTDCGPGGL